jgi:PD-(D/E)XK nuclease superfamily
MEVPYLCHEVHTSEIRAFLECRLQWQFQYRMRWEPVKRSEPLEFGTAFHVALAELYDPERWTTVKKDLFMRAWHALQDETERQVGAYLRRAGKSMLDPEEDVEIRDRLVLGNHMLRNLVRTLKDDFIPVEVEREYWVDLGMRCTCDRCAQKFRSVYGDRPWEDGLPVIFVCRIDAVFRDRESRFWIVDHKTAAQLYKPEDQDILDLDPQMGNYVWIIVILGYPATGAIYNQFRKEYPRPPKELVNSADGRRYSINHMQLTDYHTALRTFRKDMWAYRRGLYDDYLEWLKAEGKDFFRQFTIVKTPAQLASIERNLKLTVREMLPQTFDVTYNTPGRMTCRMCSFREPCLSLQGGHDFMAELEASYTQNPPYYEVRRQSQTQTKETA